MSDYFVAAWAAIQAKLVILAILTLIDVIVGVIVSLVKKDFKLEYLYHYLQTDVLPIFAWIGVVLISLIPSNLLPSGATIPIVPDVVYGTVFLSILASVLGSFSSAGVLTELFGKIGIGSGEKL